MRVLLKETDEICPKAPKIASPPQIRKLKFVPEEIGFFSSSELVRESSAGDEPERKRRTAD